MGQRKQGLGNGINDFAKLCDRFVTRLAGDYENGRTSAGEKRDGQPIGELPGGFRFDLEHFR